MDATIPVRLLAFRPPLHDDMPAVVLEINVLGEADTMDNAVRIESLLRDYPLRCDSKDIEWSEPMEYVGLWAWNGELRLDSNSGTVEAVGEWVLPTMADLDTMAAMTRNDVSRLCGCSNA